MTRVQRTWRAVRLLLAIVLLTTQSVSGSPREGEGGLSLLERIALARLEEVRNTAEVFGRVSWEGFDPSSYPSVIYEKGKWALAAGFDYPPAGFTPIEGVSFGELPVYRATSPMTPPLDSPARLGDDWVVFMELEAPEPLPDGRHMGRRTAERAIGRFIGDAFLLYLMEKRGASTPRVIGAGSYPDDPELIALAVLEQRLILQVLQTRRNERTLGEWNRSLHQLIATRRARYALVGETLTRQEQAIENWEGQRMYTEAMLFTHRVAGAFTEGDIGATDGTFQWYRSSFYLRLVNTHIAMTYAPDTPVLTYRQTTMRAVGLMFILDRFPTVIWRPDNISGELSLIDQLAKHSEFDPEQEEELLTSAKKDFAFDSALVLARSDMATILKERDGLVAGLFPAGSSRLEIVLNGERLDTYHEDPFTARSSGPGALIHEILEIEGEGLHLTIVGTEEDPAAALTHHGVSRDEVSRILITLPTGSAFLLGKKKLRPGSRPRSIGPEELRVSGPGLDLRVASGRFQATGEARLRIEVGSAE